MYITRLKLKDIRCFEKLDIKLDKPGQSLLILGDNGDGKSTVLRSIAMGLCDQSSSAALFRELPGEYVRRKPGDKEVGYGEFGRITIELASKGGEESSHRIETTIRSLDAFERVSQQLFRRKDGKWNEVEKGKWPWKESFPWTDIFVSGYGAGSRTNGTEDFQYYLAVDAVYPLFSYTVPLQNPELAIRRLIAAARQSANKEKPEKPEEPDKRQDAVLKVVQDLLAGLLDLKEGDDFLLEHTGIKVKGDWGEAELGELGDGYQATITWVLDLLAWWFLRTNKEREDKEREDKEREDKDVGEWDVEKVREVTGIVLIDEIEHHLHPRWQREILRLLDQAFPKVQFIATTHSAMTVLGTTALEEDAYELAVLRQADGHVKRVDNTEIPVGQRVDQVLTSPLFELFSASSYGVRADIQRYGELKAKTELSVSEKAELARLRDQLNSVFGPSEDELQRCVEDNVRQAVVKELSSRLSAKPVDPDVLTFEIRRKLKDLFGEGSVQ